jgi:hypothetical protein
VHPSRVGIEALSDYVASALRDLSAWSAGPYLAAVSEAGVGAVANILPNGSFANYAQNGLDTIQYSWGTNMTGATSDCSSPAKLPFTGQNWVYRRTDVGTVYPLYGDDITGFAAGDVMQFSGRVIAANMPSPAEGFTIFVDFQNGSIGDARPINQQQNNGDFSFSQEFTIPAGATKFNITFFSQDKAAYQFNNWTLINQSALDRIWKPGVQVITPA